MVDDLDIALGFFEDSSEGITIQFPANDYGIVRRAIVKRLGPPSFDLGELMKYGGKSIMLRPIPFHTDWDYSLEPVLLVELDRPVRFERDVKQYVLDYFWCEVGLTYADLISDLKADGWLDTEIRRGWRYMI